MCYVTYDSRKVRKFIYSNKAKRYRKVHGPALSVGYSANVRLLLFNEAQSRECTIEFGGRQGIAVMLVFSQECFFSTLDSSF